MLLRTAALALAVALSGCAGYVTTRTTTAVAIRPPSPIVEVAAGAPGPGFVWVDGYWNWDGYDYVWVPGYWDRPPVAGYVWYPGGWVVGNGGGYVFVSGRWVAPGYRSNVRYVHARPRSRVVVRSTPRSGGVVVRSNSRPGGAVVRTNRGGTVVRTAPPPGRTTVRASGGTTVRASGGTTVRSAPGGVVVRERGAPARGNTARSSSRSSTRVRAEGGGRASVRVR